MNNTLFDLPEKTNLRTDVLPVSVLEVGRQRGPRRDGVDHSRESSRSTYSHFPDEVSSLCLQLYLRDCQIIFDPFAGWGERHSATVGAGKSYVGYDINPIAIAEAKRVYGVDNVLADSRVAEIAPFDGLFTCPPYWNLEEYSEAGIDSCSTWQDFTWALYDIFRRAYHAAKPGAMFCVMVGDWRSKHVYYDLTLEVRLAFRALEATTIDEVIVSRLGTTKIKIMVPQALRLGYVVKVHETLLVFQKPQQR